MLVPASSLCSQSETSNIFQEMAYLVYVTGYVITQKDGRRSRCQIQAHLPVPEPGTREPTVGEAVAPFATQHRSGTGARPG
jgi:hypothetical protein